MKKSTINFIAIYLFIIVALFGFFSISGTNDISRYIFAMIYFVGLIFLYSFNKSFYKRTGSKLVYYDMIFIFAVVLVPMIPIGHGLGRVIMLMTGVIYAYYMNKAKNNVLKKTSLYKKNNI